MRRDCFASLVFSSSDISRSLHLSRSLLSLSLFRFNFGGAGGQFEVISLNASELLSARVITANGNAGNHNTTTIIFNVYGR